jgi:predicted site-specific integrase-resolvase
MHHYGQMSDSKLIGTDDAARLLGIDRSTLTRWVKAEKIKPAVTVPGYRGAHLFAVESVDAIRKGSSE